MAKQICGADLHISLMIHNQNGIDIQ